MIRLGGDDRSEYRGGGGSALRGPQCPWGGPAHSRYPHSPGGMAPLSLFPLEFLKASRLRSLGLLEKGRPSKGPTANKKHKAFQLRVSGHKKALRVEVNTSLDRTLQPQRSMFCNFSVQEFNLAHAPMRKFRSTSPSSSGGRCVNFPGRLIKPPVVAREGVPDCVHLTTNSPEEVDSNSPRYAQYMYLDVFDGLPGSPKNKLGSGSILPGAQCGASGDATIN